MACLLRPTRRGPCTVKSWRIPNLEGTALNMGDGGATLKFIIVCWLINTTKLSPWSDIATWYVPMLAGSFTVPTGETRLGVLIKPHHHLLALGRRVHLAGHGWGCSEPYVLEPPPRLDLLISRLTYLLTVR